MAPASLINASGSGRLMPLGRPVVPELYSMKLPAGSCASGSAGCSASAASRSR